MEFLFQISPYDKSSLAPQISRALEKRTEALSREQLPKIWAYTDRLNDRRTASASTLRKRCFRYRIYGVLLLAMGLFLLIPGLMEPKELLTPLLAGIFSTGAGLLVLLSGRKKQPSRFDKAAEKLLEELDSASSIQVSFSLDGMTIGQEKTVPYTAFHEIIETKDLFLLIWNEQITVLKKHDIIVGTVWDFSAFLAEHTAGAKFFQAI